MRKCASDWEIIYTVCESFGVTPDDFFGDGRHNQTVLARSAAAVLFRELTDKSYPEIAVAMGRPNHSSIVTAANRWRETYQHTNENRWRIDWVRAKIVRMLQTTEKATM